MKMNRFDWLARFFTIKPPRAKVARAKKESKPPMRRWILKGKSVPALEFIAPTKSEARGAGQAIARL